MARKTLVGSRTTRARGLIAEVSNDDEPIISPTYESFAPLPISEQDSAPFLLHTFDLNGQIRAIPHAEVVSTCKCANDLAISMRSMIVDNQHGTQILEEFLGEAASAKALCYIRDRAARSRRA